MNNVMAQSRGNAAMVIATLRYQERIHQMMAEVSKSGECSPGEYLAITYLKGVCDMGKLYASALDDNGKGAGMIAEIDAQIEDLMIRGGS